MSNETKKFANFSHEEDDAKIVKCLTTLSTLSEWPFVLFEIIAEYYRVTSTCYIFGDFYYGGFVGELKNSINSISSTSDKPQTQSSCGRLIDFQWRELPGLGSGHTAERIGDYIFVINGFPGAMFSGRVDRFHIPTLTWSLAPKLPEPRAHHGCISLENDLYCIGGDIGTYRATHSVFRYSYSNSREIWKVVQPMISARMYASYVVLNKRIYAFGDRETKSCEVYDTVTDRWTAIAELSNVRYHCRAVLVEGNILLMGGVFDNYQVDLVEEYCPLSNIWKQAAWKLPQPTHNFITWYNSQNKLLYVSFGNSSGYRVYARRMTDNDANDANDWRIVHDNILVDFGSEFSSVVVTY
jgi:hypothetical protein